ncbi:MAG: hypothetical protein MI923_18870 [Phycisphaerales bacterium]|nr:hypothetical protein [Phycisphaerales bacterium]
MTALFVKADDFLRGRAPFDPTTAGRTHDLFLLVVVFGPVYGAIMGSYAVDSADRLLQVVFAASKVPLLLFTTSVICLPGFFVLNTVLGLRDDFSTTIRAIVAGQAALSIVLASLAPFTRFFYYSSNSYQNAILFNAFMFAIATAAGHMVMLRYYRILIRRNTKHRIGLYLWLGLYAFVGMQMGWTLRPFIGSPGSPIRFFRDEPFTNAYVVIFRLFAG